jgi:hypothetical protein
MRSKVMQLEMQGVSILLKKEQYGVGDNSEES